MRSFLKFFLASFVALVVFSILSFFFMIMVVARLSTPNKVTTGANAVVVIDLSNPLREQRMEDPLRELMPFVSGEADQEPGLYDAVRLIRNAAKDDNVKGLYLKANGNGNIQLYGSAGTHGYIVKGSQGTVLGTTPTNVAVAAGGTLKVVNSGSADVIVVATIEFAPPVNT